MENKISSGIENPNFINEVENIDDRNTQLNDSKDIENNEESEDVERSNWDSPIEFLLSCISMSVGLGNIWRFPFAAYENGGGAFLIPYLIVLVLIGRPVYFLEMIIGQFASHGSIKVWSLSPFFKGVGFMSMIAVSVIVTYYTTIIATTIFYLAVSFQKTLPWTQCDDDWKECYNCTYSDCSQLYYDKTVTESLSNIDDGIGAPLWKLTLCLLAAWTLIFLSLIKGIKSSGKVAYFTAIFPYVVLITFLIRGLTLEGAWEGIEYFIKPDWEKILEPKVWHAAVGQCFFSLGTGQGTITMLASFNKFRHPTYRDALIISGMDTFTSLLGGFTIFSVLGHLSFLTGKPISEVTEGGPGLAFVSYPTAIAKFPAAPQLFSILFFLMLLTLGIGSSNALTSTLITIFSDQFPKVKLWIVTLSACVIGFLIGLMYVTPGGQFMVTFMDYYGSGFILYIICMLEVTAIAWFYGTKNFIRDIEFMLKVRVGLYWKITWNFIIPIGLFVILMYTFATSEALKHNGTTFPPIATILGWTLAGFAILLVPICGFFAAKKSAGENFKQKFSNSFYPLKKWGPRGQKFRNGWIMFKNHSELTTKIPVENNKDISLYIRGIKEKIDLKIEKGQIFIKLNLLNTSSKVEHNGAKKGLTGLCYKILKKNYYSWRVEENDFESFLVEATSSENIIKETVWIRNENNDLIIAIKF